MANRRWHWRGWRGPGLPPLVRTIMGVLSVRRWRWYVWSLAAAALLPVFLWALVVVVAPTDWARARVVALLEAHSGRRARLGGLSVRFLGGIRLTNLEIGSPRALTGPWFQADELYLDVSPFQFYRGRFRPAHVAVGGARIRALRRADGSVELADLVRPLAPRGAHRVCSGAEERVDVSVRDSALTVIDEPTSTRLTLLDLHGGGHIEGPRIVIDELAGTLNGGELRLAGRLDRTLRALEFEADALARGVKLGEGMGLLRYIVPVLNGRPASLKGRLDGMLHLQGRGPTWKTLCPALAGGGSITLDPIELKDAAMVARLSELTSLSGPRRVGSIRADFEVRDRKILTSRCLINVARLPIALSGWTDLDGRLDYRATVEGLGKRLSGKAQRFLNELAVDLAPLTTVKLQGTLDRMVVQVDGVSFDKGRPTRRGPRGRDDREALRRLGHQLRDRLLR